MFGVCCLLVVVDVGCLLLYGVVCCCFSLVADAADVVGVMVVGVYCWLLLCDGGCCDSLLFVFACVCYSFAFDTVFVVACVVVGWCCCCRWYCC